jgi:hypothetical protein
MHHPTVTDIVWLKLYINMGCVTDIAGLKLYIDMGLQPCDGIRRTIRFVRLVLKCGCNPTILQILFYTINACRTLSSTHDMYSPVVFGS